VQYQDAVEEAVVDEVVYLLLFRAKQREDRHQLMVGEGGYSARFKEGEAEVVAEGC
jgi:hypothetical protein